MDFVADTLLDGRRFRTLTVIDNWSRHSQLIEVDFTLTGTKVVAALEHVAKRSGYPQMITADNGSEFASKALDAWVYDHGIKLDFIHPGKPVENAVIESFNGRFRDECLNANGFVSIHDARQKIEAWRVDYTAARTAHSVTRPRMSLSHNVRLNRSSKKSSVLVKNCLVTGPTSAA
jgi:putative transposase